MFDINMSDDRWYVEPIRGMSDRVVIRPIPRIKEEIIVESIDIDQVNKEIEQLSKSLNDFAEDYDNLK